MKFPALLLSVFIPFLTHSQDTWFCEDQESTQIRWVNTSLGKQKVMIALPEKVDEQTSMLFFIHGDAPFNNPVEQYYIARDISASKNIISVAILRPGYEDTCGSKSDGIRGRTMGDNYTKEVIGSLVEIISELKEEYKPAESILMGHSGGAAISTLLLSQHKGLFGKAIMFSCPCNLETWRKHMYDMQNEPEWLQKMPGLSPIDFVSELDNIPVTFVVGINDDITLPSLTKEYVNAAKKLNKNITMEIWEEHDHLSVLYRAGFRRMLSLLN